MNPTATFHPAVDAGQAAAPCDADLSHDALLEHLLALGELPTLVEQSRRARQIACAALTFFEGEALERHRAEERTLFRDVLRHARAGRESDEASALVERLKDEHRNIEQLWSALAPTVRGVADGRWVDPDSDLMTRLVRDYTRHAMFEEKQFLPIARAILQRAAAG